MPTAQMLMLGSQGLGLKTLACNAANGIHTLWNSHMDLNRQLYVGQSLVIMGRTGVQHLRLQATMHILNLEDTNTTSVHFSQNLHIHNGCTLRK
jgi:hypothetical protein